MESGFTLKLVCDMIIAYSCAFSLLTREFELATRIFELVTRGFELVI